MNLLLEQMTDAKTWNAFLAAHRLPDKEGTLPQLQVGDDVFFLVFENCDFSQRNFTGYDLTGVTFLSCNLRGARFFAGPFESVYFEMCDLTDCRFQELTMSLTGFADCSLKMAHFDECTGAIMVFEPNVLVETTFEDSPVEFVYCDWKDLNDYHMRFILKKPESKEQLLQGKGRRFAHGMVVSEKEQHQ